MASIFISYRRIDTIGWAGRLFADLRRRLGDGKVFMDINGSIRRGDDFERVLNDALATCDVLLALIGPRWLDCTRDDGTRRLDARDDWVRNEAATALRRNVIVVPVLFGNTPLPPREALPDDLQPLLGRNAAAITDERWDYDVGELVNDLARGLPALLEHDDVTSANTGIALLRELIGRVPAVADAVIRSREVLENTARQVDRLDMFKTLHDALHVIEFECLRPIQQSDAAPRLRPFRVTFGSEARRMQERLAGQEMNPALRDEILDGLTLAGDAFQGALDHPGPESLAALVGELNALLSSVPPRLDAGIADAAAELDLDRLVEFMTLVRAQLPPPAAAQDSELESFVRGIDALGRLRDALQQQVGEHTQLQRLDSKLRAVCLGGSGHAGLATEWNRIKLVRSRLVPPWTPPLQMASADLAAIEAEIDQVVTGAGAEQDATDLMREYFSLGRHGLPRRRYGPEGLLPAIERSEQAAGQRAGDEPVGLNRAETAMANAGESDGAAPFESISELRRQHESLLVALDRRLEQDASAAGEAAAMETLGPDILAFQNRAVATGMFLEHIPDRTGRPGPDRLLDLEPVAHRRGCVEAPRPLRRPAVAGSEGQGLPVCRPGRVPHQHVLLRPRRRYRRPAQAGHGVSAHGRPRRLR